MHNEQARISGHFIVTAALARRLGKRQPSHSDQPLDSDHRRLRQKPGLARSILEGTESGQLTRDEIKILQKLLRDTARYLGLLQ